LAGNEPTLDNMFTENGSELMREAEETKLHSLAKVYDLLEMCEHSLNICDTPKECQSQDEQITTGW